MPTIYVTSADLTVEARADLAQAITTAVADARKVLPAKVQIFFREVKGPRERPGKGSVLISAVGHPDQGELETAVRHAIAPRLGGARVDVEWFGADRTAKGGLLRSDAHADA